MIVKKGEKALLLWEKQACFTQNIASLLQFINSKGFFVTFGEAYRTPEQAALYAKSGKGIIDSLHIRRLALDLNLFDKDGVYITDYDFYEPFGEYWETLHHLNRWGGRFKRVDSNHFEMQDL